MNINPVTAIFLNISLIHKNLFRNLLANLHELSTVLNMSRCGAALLTFRGCQALISLLKAFLVNGFFLGLLGKLVRISHPSAEHC